MTLREDILELSGVIEEGKLGKALATAATVGAIGLSAISGANTVANRVKDVRLQKDIERKELAIEHYNFEDLINMDENGKYTLMVDHRNESGKFSNFEYYTIMKKLDAFGFFNDISNCNKIIVYARDNDDFNNIIQKMTDLFIEMCDRPVNTVSERAKIKNLVMQKIERKS